MRINTYDMESRALMGERLWIGDVFGDDVDSMEAAKVDLNKQGWHIFGGGAQPGVLVTCTDAASIAKGFAAAFN